MILNDIINQKTECNICLEDSDYYIHFCSCKIRTCTSCFKKLIKITDICKCKSTGELQFELLCPICRRTYINPFNRNQIERLGIPSDEIVTKILDFNRKKKEDIYSIEVGYVSTASESSIEDDDEVDNDLLYYVTGYTLPKISKYDIINRIIEMGLKNHLDF